MVKNRNTPVSTRKLPKKKASVRGVTEKRRNSGRKSSDVSTDELSLINPIRHRHNMMDIMPFNRGIFSDPFFSDIDDLFSFNPFQLNTSMNNMLSGIRNRTFDFIGDHGLDPDRLHTPGTYHSKSQYKKSTSNKGGELITHEKTVHIDDQGKKYIEKNKTYEDLSGNTRKMTKSRYIGDRGIKHMITHDLKTGEEYIHDEFKGMNEGQLDSFNEEFDRGVKNAKRYGMIGGDISVSPRSLGSDDSKRGIDFSSRR